LHISAEKFSALGFLEFAPLQLPWIVLGELHFGAQRAQRRQEQFGYISDLLTYSTLLLPNRSTAEHYGQIKAELAQRGKPIPDNDLWIAALAKQHDLPLARDAHFSVIPRLSILAW
jgi:tRNA(fMet)-specific endonuclease VapC